MSNEYKDWLKDATDEEVLQSFENCKKQNKYYEAGFILGELTKRDIVLLESEDL